MLQLSCSLASSPSAATDAKRAICMSVLYSKRWMAYAQSLKPKGIFILSAKHGLLSPDDIIDPYQQTLKNMRSDEREKWSQSVIAELRKHWDLNTERFVFLAGVAYRDKLLPHLKNYVVPMEGLAFGKQLQWLDSQLR